MLGWLKLLAVEAREIVNTITGSNNEWWKALLFEYVAFWNIIDWLSMACSFAVVGTYIRVQMEAGAASEVLTAAQNGTSAQDAQAAFEAAEKASSTPARTSALRCSSSPCWSCFGSSSPSTRSHAWRL
ncbi:unnamed protein product [Effrenium voratum]|uniref:Uncharacterized protein n=1 Tax=Effrenium voratum TaxID=2562239 RepID=A0AA36JAC4_9DINO|nr:unnamed protein product [Effrenium voratum]